MFIGTLGYVMGEVDDGKSFSKVVLAAKSLGYTEPDPRDDLSGMDVARKALILARLLGWRINMDDVQKTFSELVFLHLIEMFKKELVQLLPEEKSFDTFASLRAQGGSSRAPKRFSIGEIERK
ncbi:hypothetical protein B296_00027160 [Ensete ventricosum]|uniref:Homoserine dehydrogenase n=1 Tax=Ensete ventricosum TaxID=4639 RepID=A0A427AQ91_ENSVE|nr:hypothetical protein B296_00027160 [Ensete ventricosum]